MTIGMAFMFIDYATEKPRANEQGVIKAEDMTPEELRAKREELRRQYGNIDGDTG